MTQDAKDTDELLATVDAWLVERDRLQTHLEAEVERLTTELAATRRALALLGPTHSWTRKPGSDTEAILDFVAAHPGCTSGEIRKATGNGTTCSVLATRPHPRLRREKINGEWRYFPMTQVRRAPQATDVSNEAKEK